MDDTPLNETPQPTFYTCPHCQQEVEATPTPEAQMISCPHCTSEFVIPALTDAQDADETDQPDDDDLSSLRIHAVTQIRRAAIRSRSYLIILISICLVGIVQLSLNIYHHLRHGDWGRKPLGYAIFILLLTLLTLHFIRRAIEYHQEIRRSALTTPTTPPDFSPLSDGSQHWKNLERFTQ